MKNIFKIFRIIVLIVVIGFSFTACPEELDIKDIITNVNSNGENTSNDEITSEINDQWPIVTWNVHNFTTWEDAHHGITNGGNEKNHVINVSGNITIPPTSTISNTFGNLNNIIIILQGNGTISISGNGNMFRIGNEQTFILKNLTLQGIENTAPLVVVNYGTFKMEGSAKITGNTFHSTNSDVNGGGVRIFQGTLIMQDESSISGNTASTSGLNMNARGGGVYIDGGNFIMKDNAKIENNTSSINQSVNLASGGGVYVNNGTFTMENGYISNNTASGGSGNASGGGVHTVLGTNFIMYNGKISGNIISGRRDAYGGGVRAIGNFSMYNGKILNNSVIAINTGSNGVVYAEGGGVAGRLVMHDGTISGNSVTAGRTWGDNHVYAHGGGVYSGQLTMNGGIISGNTVIASNNVNVNMATADGGGVYSSGSLNKTGGIIYGNHESENLRNVAIGGRGHAVFNLSSSRWRNATAGTTDNSDRLDFWLNEIDITYSVTHNNWPPTSLTFTFSEDPGNINASDITFCNNVSSGSAILSGSGTTRTLSPVTISGNGIITASIFPVYKVFTGYKNLYLIPPAPTGIITKPTASTVTLEWVPVSLTTSYRIYHSTSLFGIYNLIETTSTNKFVNIRRPKNSSNFYKITAINAAGESPPAEISAVTLSDNTSEAIAASSSVIVIEWPRDTSEQIWMSIHNIIMDSVNNLLPIPIFVTHSSYFRIYRNGAFLRNIEIPTNLIGITPVQNLNLLEHYFEDTGLNPNTSYNYRIDLQYNLNYGILSTPTSRTETVMTGSATTFSK